MNWITGHGLQFGFDALVPSGHSDSQDFGVLLSSDPPPPPTSTLSDLVAYGEMTFSGRVPDQGPAAEEVSRLIGELRSLGWISARQDALT